ncbi:hypothetical protein LZL87_013944 [Fusarium oxysporum]|nr:hypothetical protein LZL87_013944 [Fusarium oxysporum]
MAGAEAILVLNVISSIIGILDGAKTVYEATQNAIGLPPAFNEVSKRIPLVRSILVAADKYIRQDNLNEESCKAMRSIVEGCEHKAKKLEGIFQKVLPGEDASRAERYLKALKTVGKGDRVELLMKGMLEDVQLLASNHGMETVTTSDLEQITEAIKEISSMPPSAQEKDGSLSVAMYGDGVQYTYYSERDQFVSHGGGAQYRAESMTFSGFFKSDFIRSWKSPGWPIPRSYLRGAAVIAECGDIKLTMPIGTSYGEIVSAFLNTIPGAVAEFQETFPDGSGFRVALVDQCLQLRNSIPRSVGFTSSKPPGYIMLKRLKAKLVDLGLSFLILALTMSHGTKCKILGGSLAHVEPLPVRTQRKLNKAIRLHAKLCISILLERILRILLSSIEQLLKHLRREDWVTACFAICLILMGAESLQVDICLNKAYISGDMDAMEESAIKFLVGLFRKSTNGFSPLQIA